ncbi:MAG: FAD-binding oxidoreductase [Candidatus Heimdallarchaeota archaeon]|nr:FAD-binding oxidoreductase [Candidatus Heimdallarchaeota archaeon]
MDKLERYVIGANASIFQKINPDTNIAVFNPKNEAEIKIAIDFAREHHLPITSKGGGSGLSGACTGASRDKVIISSMRLKKVHELNFEKGYALVESGITPDELNEIIQKEHPDWKFFVAPSSRDIATLGGILNTDGGGNDTWLAGTMVDNVLAVELIDYNNNIITIEKIENDVSKAKITCNNKKLEKQLQDKNFSLIDIASSHGVLGFVFKLKVLIRSKEKAASVKFALVRANSMKSFGEIIHQMIKIDIPITYGEAIVEAHHQEISNPTKPPMFILEYPEKFDEQIQAICKESENVDYNPINKEEFERMKDIRVKMAKRNPPQGYQIALFEGYGIYGGNLLRYDEIIATINEKLRKHTFEPFIKFGHAPSVWYEDGKKIKGIIMHSREKRPKTLTPTIVFDAIVELVKTCEELGVTPKPEHKWPFSRNTQKYTRLIELTEILGKQFNPFILDCKLDELADLVL